MDTTERWERNFSRLSGIYISNEASAEIKRKVGETTSRGEIERMINAATIPGFDELGGRVVCRYLLCF